MVKTVAGLSGHVNAVLRDSYGYLKEERDGPNTVTNLGLGRITSLIGEGLTPGNKWGWIAIGSSDAAATESQTSLEGEITTANGDRDASTVTAETESTNGDTLQLVSGWNFSADMTIRESGVFNQLAVGGDMLCRQTFTALPVDSGDSLTITWKITLDQSA